MPSLALALMLGELLELGLLLALGLMLALGDSEAEGVALVLLLGDLLALGELDWLALGDCEAEGDSDLLELAEGLREADGDKEADGLRLALGDSERDGEADGLKLAEGDSDALGDCEALGEKLVEVRPGASPNQSTPGRGPGLPSSYKNKLSARSRAFSGRRDLSIRVITPRLKLPKVWNWGVGKLVGPELVDAKGITYPTKFHYDRLRPTGQPSYRSRWSSSFALRRFRRRL